MMIAEDEIEADAAVAHVAVPSPINFGDETLSDAILVVDNQEFKVHKMILANTSDFFKTLLFEDPENNGKDRIEIEDVNVDTFRRFLELVYYGKISDASEFLNYPMNGNRHYEIVLMSMGNENPAPLAPYTHYASSLRSFFHDFWDNITELLQVARRFKVKTIIWDYIAPIITNSIRNCTKEGCHQCINCFVFAIMTKTIDVSNCQKKYPKWLFTEFASYARGWPYPDAIPVSALIPICNHLKDDLNPQDGIRYLSRIARDQIDIAMNQIAQYDRTHRFQYPQ